jgi:hypothetical protein
MFWLIFYESNVWDGNLRSALFRLVKMKFSCSHARQREATWSPSPRCQPMSASSCRWWTPSLALWAFWMVAVTLIETTLLPTHPVLSWVRHQHRCTILLHGHQCTCSKDMLMPSTVCWYESISSTWSICHVAGFSNLSQFHRIDTVLLLE